MAVRVRPSRGASQTFPGLIVAALLLAGLWLTFGDALTRATSGARGGSVVAATVRRDGDRARLSVAGRVRSGSSGSPVAIRVLGNTAVAGPCPVPVVARGTAVADVPGGVRVGWRAVSGWRPGWALERGRPFAMTGSVRLPPSGALRLCVHLVRGGARPAVLRTTEVVVPDEHGMTPLWAGVRPLLVGHVVPAARVVLAVLLVAIALRIVVLWRRRGRRGRPGLVGVGLRRWQMRWRTRRVGSPSRGAGETPKGPAPPWPGGDSTSARTRPASFRGGTDRSSDVLPPLPPGVRVPDAPPWPAPGTPPGADPATGEHAPPVGAPRGAPQEDDGPAARDGGPGAVTPPPTHDRDAAGRSAEQTGRRREARWRARRRREAEAAGVPYDASEPVPGHVEAWARGAEGERLAAERFGLHAVDCPAVHVLHDRRWPGRRRANIDHVLVGPAGVVVADTKHWSGDLRIADGRLRVGGWDQAKALDGVAAQVAAVRTLLAAGGHATVPVVGVLHLTAADGVCLDGSLAVRGIPLLDAPCTMRRAAEPTALDASTVHRVLRCLQDGLPRAAGPRTARRTP